MALGAKADGICTVQPRGKPGDPACSPYLCDGANSQCPASCLANADCAANFVCSCNNVCVPLQAAGACCARNDQCGGGVCANGVCCNSICNNACASCTLMGSVGTCANLPAGQPGAPPCAPYACNGISPNCPGSCGKDADCANGNICNCLGQCVLPQGNGACCA